MEELIGAAVTPDFAELVKGLSTGGNLLQARRARFSLAKAPRPILNQMKSGFFETLIVNPARAGSEVLALAKFTESGGECCVQPLSVQTLPSPPPGPGSTPHPLDILSQSYIPSSAILPLHQTRTHARFGHNKLWGKAEPHSPFPLASAVACVAPCSPRAALRSASRLGATPPTSSPRAACRLPRRLLRAAPPRDVARSTRPTPPATTAGAFRRAAALATAACTACVRKPQCPFKVCCVALPADL
eukprot:6203395-Pleurochrysis_carterae.AAC.2